jgi:hypothetical protein
MAVNADSQDHDDLLHAEHRAASPVVGGVAGVLFAVLFSLSLGIMLLTMSVLPHDTGDWLTSGADRLRFAVGLLPFAGLFFLWFIAVIRQQLGSREDQFFATVFLGSGLLFLAMVFSAAASVGAIAAGYTRDPSGFAGSTTYFYARATIAEIFTVYALRMAAVFQISGATLWLRTGAMPRWMALLTYAVALVFLFTLSQSLWLVMLFPAWVLLVSIYILANRLKEPAARSSGRLPVRDREAAAGS